MSNWEPNDNQLAALEYIRDKEYLVNVSEMARTIGISRQAIYQWNSCADFVKWWGAKRQEHFGSRLDHVHGMVYARATGRSKKGSVQDAKLFLERFDTAYAPRTRADVQVDGTVKTYVNVDVKRVTGETDEKLLPEAGSDPPGAPKGAVGTPAVPEGD